MVEPRILSCRVPGTDNQKSRKVRNRTHPTWVYFLLAVPASRDFTLTAAMVFLSRNMPMENENHEWDMLNGNELIYPGRWVARAAMLGDAKAMKLCSLTSHHSYWAKPVEIAELLEWVKRVAILGDVQAIRFLVSYYRNGLINTNDKVVCIDDTDEGYNKHDVPDGFLQQGRVYCVSGWSECGGFILVGLRCLWKIDGSEVGFNAMRFCTLKCSRRIFRRR